MPPVQSTGEQHVSTKRHVPADDKKMRTERKYFAISYNQTKKKEFLRARSFFLGGVEDVILNVRAFGVACLLSPLSSEYSVS